MSENKPWHLVVFACCLGVVIYLASALWSALFIIDVPQAPDAVVDFVEIEQQVSGRYYDDSYTEASPTKFKNTLEELKYHHNVTMLERNRYWFYGTLIFGAFAGYVAFSLIPRWRARAGIHSGPPTSAISSAFLGAFVAAVLPMLLGWILPAPVEWFPRRICEMADARQSQALAKLEEAAARYDRP
jgi:uncharacterized membrane protein YraQ (UPF0718 family)